MTETNFDRLRLLPDRSLSSLHRFRDFHHRRSRLRIGFELPDVVLSPRTANWRLLFRHSFHFSLEGLRSVSSELVVSDSIEGVYLRNQAPQMNEGRIRKIIHVDMDAFYASVEQRDNANLKGKPVAVGHPASRGFGAAASYEAGAFGVPSAMPLFVAARKCAELVFVP